MPETYNNLQFIFVSPYSAPTYSAIPLVLGTGVVFINLSEAGSGAEAVLLEIPQSDLNTGVIDAYLNSSIFSLGDNGSAAEGLGLFLVPVADSGAGVSVEALAAAALSSDAASSSETQIMLLFNADNSSGADVITSLYAVVSLGESGSAIDTVAILELIVGDTVIDIASETLTLTGLLSLIDSAVGGESTPVIALTLGDNSGGVAFVGTIDALRALADNGAGGESIGGVGLDITDFNLSTTEAMGSGISLADLAAGLEATYGQINIELSDYDSFVDLVLDVGTQLYLADLGVGVESITELLNIFSEFDFSALALDEYETDSTLSGNDVSLAVGEGSWDQVSVFGDELHDIVETISYVLDATQKDSGQGILERGLAALNAAHQGAIHGEGSVGVGGIGDQAVPAVAGTFATGKIQREGSF